MKMGTVLPVVTMACLEEYFERISKLNSDFPECWHLLTQAEDRCRGQQFGRIRRTLTRALMEGRLPTNQPFSLKQPWIGVFTFAARDGEYWNEHMVRPAQNFLARGGAGRKMSREAADESHMSQAAREASSAGQYQGIPSPFGQGVSRNARRRKRLREDEPDAAPEAGGRKAKGAAKGENRSLHPRKVSGVYITDEDGNQVCFKYAKGQAKSLVRRAAHMVASSVWAATRMPSARAMWVARGSPSDRRSPAP